jgi:hypothetical protein
MRPANTRINLSGRGALVSDFVHDLDSKGIDCGDDRLDLRQECPLDRLLLSI